MAKRQTNRQGNFFEDERYKDHSFDKNSVRERRRKAQRNKNKNKYNLY